MREATNPRCPPSFSACADWYHGESEPREPRDFRHVTGAGRGRRAKDSPFDGRAAPSHTFPRAPGSPRLCVGRAGDSPSSQGHGQRSPSAAAPRRATVSERPRCFAPLRNPSSRRVGDDSTSWSAPRDCSRARRSGSARCHAAPHVSVIYGALLQRVAPFSPSPSAPRPDEPSAARRVGRVGREEDEPPLLPTPSRRWSRPTAAPETASTIESAREQVCRELHEGSFAVFGPNSQQKRLPPITFFIHRFPSQVLHRLPPKFDEFQGILAARRRPLTSINLVECATCSI